MSVTDRVKIVMDSIKPLVLARDFEKVCQRLESESATAVHEQRLADAASLSAILGSFRSITGDDHAALAAFRYAEDLEADNAHHALATAAHLFFRLDRRDEATRKVDGVMNRSKLDPLARYKTITLLGRFAEADGRIDEAVRLLVEAHTVAQAAPLDPLWWELALVRSLAGRGAGTDASVTYLKDLIERAKRAGDDRVSEAASEILTQISMAR